VAIGLVLVLLVALSFWPARADDDEEKAATAPAGARPGAFPTPPMPAGGAVQGPAEPLTFRTPTTTVPAGTGED
jgi:NADH-quinone oxidoreductase subunit H